jgi:phosphoenolpyruvate-protein kinase (PTS system EI component)
VASAGHAAIRTCSNTRRAIGLVRSEFIGSDRSQPPDVAFFRQAFKALDESAGTLTLTIRLIDLASDKPPGWLAGARDLLRPLGMQGARLYRHKPIRRVLDAQLAAIAGLAERRAAEVLIPYLDSLPELTHWTRLVRDALPEGVPVGAMLETPAAVLDIRNCSAMTDFVAIGCNDLMQCLFGADRDEPRVRDSLAPYAPVLYRLLGDAAADVPERRESVRLCGVLPRLAGVLPLLVGIGFRGFSLDPVWIPYLARDLSALTLRDVADLARRVTACRHSHEVRTLLGLPAT